MVKPEIYAFERAVWHYLKDSIENKNVIPNMTVCGFQRIPDGLRVIPLPLKSPPKTLDVKGHIMDFVASKVYEVENNTESFLPGTSAIVTEAVLYGGESDEDFTDLGIHIVALVRHNNRVVKSHAPLNKKKCKLLDIHSEPEESGSVYQAVDTAIQAIYTS